MKVCFSGTFNVLHKGHKELIDKAFEVAGKKGTVFIGVTKGPISKKKDFKKPVSERVKEIEEYLSSKGYDDRASIKIISDRFGPAVYGDYDAIVVSPGSFENAKDINEKRVENKKKPLKIIKVPYVLASDGKKISSTRILNKEMDKEGQVL